VVEVEAITQGIRMSKGIEPVLVSRQEIIFLPKAKLTITKGVLMVVKVKYNEPRLNQ
jgi:hypothetical protein